MWGLALPRVAENGTNLDVPTQKGVSLIHLQPQQREEDGWKRNFLERTLSQSSD